jgi:replication factor C small subunit
MSSLTNKLWVDKWAPKTIDEIVLPELEKNQLRNFINKGEIPNLLFTGIQGSGKTTTANIIIDHIIDNKDDVLIINGSLTTGIDMVRTKIDNFCGSYPLGNSKHKIVFIDEADYLSPNAQSSLRNLIEKYQSNVRFIFTGNYLSKIIPALQSRCSGYIFKSLPKDDLLNFITKNLDNENVSYNIKDIQNIIDISYPDVRKIINTLQKLSIDNKIVVDDINNIMDVEDKIVNIIKEIIIFLKIGNTNNMSNSINKLLTLLKDDYGLNYPSVYKRIFDDDDIPTPVKIICNDYSIKHSNALIPTMNFAAFVYKIIDFYKTFPYKV